MDILNIAAYRFVTLPDAGSLVAPLRAGCDAASLKGTILVADEGINLFLAGPAAAVEAFVDWLGSEPSLVDAAGRPAFADLVVKRSVSTDVPFKRLRVKHRAEIVTMRTPRIRPDLRRAPSVTPEELAAWLARGHDDDGRPVVLLDTRNAFEVEHGAFDGAVHLALERFEQWPAAVDARPPPTADRTIVTYCTGGIRCEKAALYLQDRGYPHVRQLDGGILAYFERVGRDHWHGDCFVFDERRTLDADLKTPGR